MAEDLLSSTSTDQRPLKGIQYYKLSNELSSETSAAISDFIEGHINNNQLKQKINSLHTEYLQKISNV
ncbi:unnamed protein product [Rotaria sordida]|uniref:Uncharacterized protein n=1 Tax=Rotaria sordida TaxID=392033 RepID=A0A814UYS5_9BILA|nr:unnamed protein product [Rotaria sordida]CAF1441959.1 unnamed protein product [Rotaria sordida]